MKTFFFAAATLAGVVLSVGGCSSDPATPPPTRISPATAQLLLPKAQCDASLWAHVYAGDPHKFSKPQDRLRILRDCVTITGTIERAMHKPDGDMHILLKPDPEYAEMLNDRNVTGQRGNLVLEPVCVGASVPWIRLRHACDDFKQAFDKSLVGQHVQVVGAFVTDMDHGWNEIHPVTSIARK